MERVVDRLDHEPLRHPRPPAEDPPQLGELGLERRRRVRVRVLEEERDVRLGLRLRGGDRELHRVERLRLDRRLEVVVEDPAPPQIALVAAEALVLLLLLDPLEVDVDARVVGGRVRRRPVADRLDQRRPAARAPALDRLARRLEHREHVAAVHAHARDPVAGRLGGDRLRPRLRAHRRRDRPLVVVAEEDERRAHHGREVRALVEGALARRAVAEVGDRDRVLAAQLLAPGEPGGVRDVRADRDADRGDVVVGRVPPAGRVAAPPLQDRRGGDPAQEPDRRLAIAGEDPVLVGERVRRAGLHRLVVPEDRVRADPALAVVDERALVVGPQQDERPVEVEQLLLPEPVDLAVLVDDAAELRVAVDEVGHRAEA